MQPFQLLIFYCSYYFNVYFMNLSVLFFKFCVPATLGRVSLEKETSDLLGTYLGK